MDLVEREDVLRRLDVLLARARAGNGQIALIRGEVGIGKTSVAKALTSSVAGEAHVLWGSCDDLLTPRPFGPFWDMAFDEPRLSRALTENNPNLVLESLLELFTRAIRPTVAVIEDVHWADGATIDVLTTLGRRIDRTHALLAVTFRDTVSADHPLSLMLGALPQARVDNIELRPLSHEAVIQMTRSAELGARIWDLTAGNPFYVAELLNSAPGEISASVRDVVRSHLARLTAKGERLVRLASVVPRQLELALVDAIDASLRASIGETEEAGLLSMQGDSLHFRHELARSAIETSLSESQRREMNLEVLEACESLGLDVTRCAHHARRANAVDAMVRWLPAAAEKAADAHSHREAVAHLRALEPYTDHLPPRERAATFEMWAFEEEFVSGTGLDQALQGVQLRRSLGDSAELGASLLRASRSAYFSGDRRLAKEFTAEAVEVLAETGGEELAAGYAELSRLAMLDYEFDRAAEYGEMALALAPEPSLPRANALTNIGTAEAIRSYPEGADLLRESAATSQTLGAGRELHRARGNLIAVALLWKDLRVAEELNDRSLQELRDESPATSAWHVGTRARIHLLRGEYDLAASMLRELLDRRDLEAGDRIGVATSFAKVLVRTGHPDARNAIEEAWEIAAAFGEGQNWPDLATRWAEYLYVFGRRDESITRRNLDVLKHAESVGIPWEVADLGIWLWLDGHIDRIPAEAAQPVRWLGDGEWERAAAWYSERGLPYERAVALSRGDERAQLEALAIADEIEAKPLASRLRGRLRNLGVRGVPRGPRAATRTSPIGLTPRQTEVLRLMADGLSNSAIGDRLFISPRTVEKHVAAVLEKTGAHSRGEAVRIARDKGLL